MFVFPQIYEYGKRHEHSPNIIIFKTIDTNTSNIIFNKKQPRLVSHTNLGCFIIVPTDIVTCKSKCSKQFGKVWFRLYDNGLVYVLPYSRRTQNLCPL